MSTQQELLRDLDLNFTEPVRDPLWQHIHLTPGLLRLVDTAEFQQLNRIRQLGPTFLVYPGATHTRFNHSLGVLHIARRLLQHLVRCADAPAFSREGVRAFLAAALLHDVGHFPYTHSFKSLALEEHERLTAGLVQQGRLASRLRDDVGVEPAVVAAIVDTTLPIERIRNLANPEEIRLFRRILSGSLDPDKLDYLNRDAYFCGVPYGMQDVDFAISRIRPDGYDGIGVDGAGATAVENVLFSKYLMYRSVYWHHTVRVATAMIKKAVFLALREEVVAATELYGLDDTTLHSIATSRRFPPLDLIERVENRDLLKPVVDIPFDPDNPLHTQLEDETVRTELEHRIALALRGTGGGMPEEHEVIVDLPDPVSFEADLSVFSNSGVIPFSQRSVFSPAVISRFSTSLRRIRLILPEKTAGGIPDAPRFFAEILQDV